MGLIKDILTASEKVTNNEDKQLNAIELNNLFYFLWAYNIITIEEKEKLLEDMKNGQIL